MRQVRTVALSRHAAPAFVMVAGLELMTLRRLSWLARALFFELAAMADFTTGQGRTSWAVLCALLDFDRTPKAHATPGATVKRLRGAFDELCGAGLVKRDTVKNEKTQALIFRIQARTGISAPDAMRGRVTGRAQSADSPAKARVSKRRPRDEGQDEGQRVQEPKTYPLSPSLSTPATPTKPPASIGQLLDRMRPPRG